MLKTPDALDRISLATRDEKVGHRGAYGNWCRKPSAHMGTAEVNRTRDERHSS